MAVHTYAAPEHRAELWLEWEQGLRKLLENAEPGSDHQLTFARAYAAAAHTDQAIADLEALLDGSLAFEGLAVDADLRWTLLNGLARTGHAEEERIAAELAPRQHHLRPGARRCRARRAPDRRGEGRGLGAGDGRPRRTERDPPQRRAGLQAARPGRGAGAVRREVPRRRRQHLGPLGPAKGAVALEHIFPRVLASAELLATLDAWLESASANPGALRYVTEGRADVARALAAQAKDAAG